MSRLIVFGCSYTYGQGLADCYVPPNDCGPVPSQLGWPNQLAHRLGLDLINNSAPGSSNIQILWRLLNFKFQEDDLCVTMWSHFDRHPYSKLRFDPSVIKWDEYENSFITRNGNLDVEDLSIRNYISIYNGYLHLLSKNIKHLFIVYPKDIKIFEAPKLEIPTLVKEFICPVVVEDYACDDMHPGPKTHTNIANYIYNKLHVIR